MLFKILSTKSLKTWSFLMAINFSMMGFADRLAQRDDYQLQTNTIEVKANDEPKQEYERLSEAKRLYPYLQDKDFDYVENLTDDKKAGYLEFWEPGDEGPPDGSVKRPEGIGIDRMGIEVRNPKTRPIDILGDYASHEGIYSDPKLKDIYDRYTSTLTDEQLKVKYEYEKKNYGEDRPFEQWAERSGKPGMFRGYTFDQFSEEEINEAYTDEQKAILDEARKYLGVKKLNYEGKDVEINNNDFQSKLLPSVFKAEGGYSDDPTDTGNFIGGDTSSTLVGTNHGISADVLSEYLKRPATAEDMKSLTKDKAKEIYEKVFYTDMGIDKLPKDVQEIVFHGVVNSKGHAIKVVQKLLGLKEDGVVGPKTMEAMKNADFTKEEFKDALLDKYKTFKTWDKHGEGWTNRFEELAK